MNSSAAMLIAALAMMRPGDENASAGVGSALIGAGPDVTPWPLVTALAPTGAPWRNSTNAPGALGSVMPPATHFVPSFDMIHCTGWL